MRVLYLGQKPIGEACFDICCHNENDKFKIVTAVSNKESKNTWWKSNRIYERCKQNGITFIDNRRPNEDIILQTILEKNIDMIISVGHKYILSAEILNAVNQNAINMHLAILPDYKGNYTYNHAILNEEKEYGITIHWMSEKVDQGDIIALPRFNISSKDTAYSLYNKSIELGLTTFGRIIGMLAAGQQLPRIKMNSGGCFYGRKSLDGKREIPSDADPNTIQKMSRAFYFPNFEAAYFVIGEMKYYVLPDCD